MSQAALSVVLLEGFETGPVVRALTLRALSATLPGRFAVLLWPTSLAWQDEAPIEAEALEAAMGAPESRREDKLEPVGLHANLVVRSYGADPLVPARCFQALVLRRAGESPIARRKQAGVPEAAAKLDTTRPAFTRDWANNTWHVRDEGAEDRIIARLARLLRWPDETVLLLRPGQDAPVPCTPGPAPDGDLVGVPERYAIPPAAPG